MTTFWIVSAVLIIVALAMVAPTLLRSRKAMVQDRNQQNVVIAQERLAELEADLANGVMTQVQFDQTKLELEQALLLDLRDEQQTAPEEASVIPGRAALGLLALFVPALTIGLYIYLGSPQLTAVDANAMAHQNAAGKQQMPSVEEMKDALVARLKENPEDAEGWFLLGRTYMVVKDYPNAVKAFEAVYNLVGDEPSIMLSLADAEAMAQKGAMSGRPAQLIRKAVELAPDDLTARWLAGMVEDQAGNLEQALAHFRALEPMLADDEESLTRVQGMIGSLAERLQQQDSTQTAPAAGVAPEPAASGTQLRVRVSIGTEYAGKMGPEETVFVYAKAIEGPGMPLAAARLKVKDLPLEIVLDDSSAMMPQMRLSNFAEVKVGARVSRSGNAIAQSGDVAGEVSSVVVANAGLVDVVIDRTIP